MAESITTYPDGVVAVPKAIPGLAFFPGGSGIWQGADGSSSADIPQNGVMVLGHNFDSLSGFNKSLRNGTENRKGSTWRPLIALLERAKVDLHRCFFTNFFMGLIAEGSSVGKFPGANDPQFVQMCRSFLVQQIGIQKPGYILILGIHVPPLIASMSPELAPWSGITSLVDLDRKNIALVPRAYFRDADHACPVVVLTHPCNRHLNVARRRYGVFHGDEAEVQMISEASPPRYNPSP